VLGLLGALVWAFGPPGGVDEYIEDVRAEVREALSMPSSGTTSTSTGSTAKSTSSPGKVSTTVPAASAVSTGSTKTKSI
jgi:hypothetical protein